MAKPVIIAVCLLAVLATARADFVTANVPTAGMGIAAAVNPVTNKVYVASYNGTTVTVISAATNDTHCVTVGSYPYAVAVNPVTNRVYVANFNSNNVTVIDGATDGVVATVPAGSNPAGLAVNPVTNKVYVTNSGGSSVTVINGADNSTQTVTVGSNPYGVAVNPVTNKIFVANLGSNTVTVIDGSTNYTLSVTVGASPYGVAVNPVTNRVYVANYGMGSGNTVTMIDGSTYVPTTIAVGTSPEAIAVNLATNRVYAANYGSANVSVINGATNGVVATVAVGTNPASLAVNPVTNKVYVPSMGMNGTGLTVINGADNTTQTLSMGVYPSIAVAVNPVTNKVYVTLYMSLNVVVVGGSTNATTSVGAGSNPAAVAVNPVTDKIYVANYNGATVTVIDGATSGVATVSTGSWPMAVAVNPVTNKVYVVDYGSWNVTVIDGATNSTTTVATDTNPRAVAVNPVTNKVYVVNYYSGNVTVIDGATNDATTVAAGIAPWAVAVNPVTNKVYVANSGSNNVTVIDGADNSTQTVAAGNGPRAVAVNPATNKVYVANYFTSNVTVIDGATNGVLTLSAGTNPRAVAVNPATNKVYVANSGNNSVTVISGADNSTQTFAAGTNPCAVAVDPVTNKVYVPDSGSGNVTMIDGATNAVTPVTTGASPAAVAVNPVTGMVYVANYGSNNVTVISEAPNNDVGVRAVLDQPAGYTTNEARPALTGSGVIRWIGGRTQMMGVANRLNTSQKAWDWATVTHGAGTDSITWTYAWGADSLIMGENFICAEPLESDAGTTNNQGVGTPFAGNLVVCPVYRVVHSGPPVTPGWNRLPDVLSGGKSKNVKDGGALAYGKEGTGGLGSGLGNDTGFVYAFKGNNTYEFYRFNTATNAWIARDSIPAAGRSGKKKAVKKGAALTVGTDGKVYGAKGNNTYEFWCYAPAQPAGQHWTQLTDVPPGSKALKEGTGLAAVNVSGTSYIYVLKGSGTYEFYRYKISDGTWATMANALGGASGKPYKYGSSITYDGGDTIWAMKGNNNELFAYSISQNNWVTKDTMPKKVPGGTKKTKVKDGSQIASDGNRTIYALKGGNTNEFWTYLCNSRTWVVATPMPSGSKNVKGGGALVYAGDLGCLYALRGNNTLEFWQYVPLTAGGSRLAADGPEVQTANSLPPTANSLKIAPNPFPQSLDPSISYSLSVPGNVSLRLYDITGKLVSTLAGGYHPAGSYSLQLTANGLWQKLAAGIYVLRLDSDGYSTTQKLIIE